MKIKQRQKLSTAAAVLALIVTTITASAQKMTTPPEITTPDKVETSLGTLEFKDGVPNAATVQKVRDNLDYIRGVDAFMNSISGASAYAIRKGARAGSQTYPSAAAAANADGSTTLYFGPTKPADAKEGTWIQTMPGKGWFTALRLYSPLASFFDKSWKPSEFELVK